MTYYKFPVMQVYFLLSACSFLFLVIFIPRLGLLFCHFKFLILNCCLCICLQWDWNGLCFVVRKRDELAYKPLENDRLVFHSKSSLPTHAYCLIYFDVAFVGFPQPVYVLVLVEN